MTTYNVEGVSQVLVEVSPDIHICGFCKQQYNNFQAFLAHKQNGCSTPASDISDAPTLVTTLPDSSTEFVFEETYQTCVTRGVKKILTKAQKTPTKKLKPALTSKRHSCCFSGCTFRTQYGQKDMERHLKTHTGEKPFECELCHKRFSRRDKLNMHSRSHTGEKPHKCKHCPYAAADSSSLKKHLRIHYDERPFKCQICPYASRNSSQLTVHLRSHTGDAPFQCQQCDAKFKINSDLKRHVRIHSGEKPYKCDFCDYCCAMKGNLKSHVQIKHSAGNPFHCPECDFRCANKASLRQHSREHQPTQPIQCSKCTYSCSSRGALKVHERIHSEERPFKCDFCTFATKQRSNLVIHRKKCHADSPDKGSGSARNKCSRGGSGEDDPKPVSSRYRSKLEATRAFTCDRCDASFVREDSLRSHRKQHRGSSQPSLAPALAAVQSGPVTLGPASPAATTTPLLQVPLSSDPLCPYGSAQLKIIVSHPLGHDGSFLHTGVDGVSKTSGGTLLLSPENQDMVVNSMLQQVNLLTPQQQHVGPQGVEPLEQQTLLLAQLAPGDHGTQLLHQALLQSAVASQDSVDNGGANGSSSQTFITTCSDLDSLNALIREGGTEVTVVTEGNNNSNNNNSNNTSSAVAMGIPRDVVCGSVRELAKQTLATAVGQDRSASACRGDSRPQTPNISLGGQGVVIHNLPLIVSTHPQEHTALEQLSPHNLYSDTESIPQ